jgi:hypothetical protein
MSNTFHEPAKLAEQLTHPYSRYGLAIALREHKLPAAIADDELRAALQFAIRVGLDNFRLRTTDLPQWGGELNFTFIPGDELLKNANLVQSAGLAAKGMYLHPAVVTIDGGAKDTVKNAQLLLEALDPERKKDLLTSSFELSRSFAPTTAKINNGTASQTPPKGTLLEAACTMITTLTPSKPAAWPGINTVIIPDLPLLKSDEEDSSDSQVTQAAAEIKSPARNFMNLFDAMFGADTKNLMKAKLPTKPLPAAAAPKAGKAPKEAKEVPTPYRRPRLHGGNYPDAPFQADAFGAVGLLGAIGRWARRAHQTPWAKQVLASLTDAPLYLVSYDRIRQVRFGHHVVRLAQENKLADIVASLYRDTVLYRDAEPQRRYDNPTYQLFYFTAERFLQLFNPPAFADFLAHRAEYSPTLLPLFNEYFMGNLRISPEVVQSVKALGRWLNSTAYRVADQEIPKAKSPEEIKNRPLLVKKFKAKILVEFESAALSAETSDELLFRISTRAGRLLGSDAPAAADLFMDAVALGKDKDGGGLSKEEATHLLIAYMRLRNTTRKTTDPTSESNATESSADDSDDADTATTLGS